MNITVTQENNPNLYQTGGGCASVDLNITIDEDAPLETKQETVIHEIIENYCRSWVHSKVDELTLYILEGLGQL